MPRVKPNAPDADPFCVTPARVLSLLAACASPIFMCAAIAGWLYGVWPANPYTMPDCSASTVFLPTTRGGLVSSTFSSCAARRDSAFR